MKTFHFPDSDLGEMLSVGSRWFAVQELVLRLLG